MKLLVKYPTRSRPVQFLKVLGLYRSLLSGKHEAEFVISADADDPSMNNNSMHAILDPQPDVRFCVGNSKTKIQAINANLGGRVFDVLLLASDDMLPVVVGYDDIIFTLMLKHFPQLDGCLHFYDGYRKTRLNTLPVMGRALYERLGYIYHPAYTSLWCDNEFQAVTEKWGKAVYIEQVIIRHEWKACNDELRRRNDVFASRDAQTFKRRKALGFPK